MRRVTKVINPNNINKLPSGKGLFALFVPGFSDDVPFVCLIVNYTINIKKDIGNLMYQKVTKTDLANFLNSGKVKLLIYEIFTDSDSNTIDKKFKEWKDLYTPLFESENFSLSY